MSLVDLTVLDIATLAAAPQIAAFFGDFGARVIKVEPPGGDPLRKLLDPTGAPLSWRIVNRNKECVTLDLTKPRGRALLERMLARTDVLVTGHSASRLERLGLEARALRARFPKLVAVNLTAFGTSGPWAERPGSGTLAEAAAGLAAVTGEPDGPPGLSPVGLGDTLGVLQGIIAALLGLLERGDSGEGEAIDVAMYEPVLQLLATRLATADRTGSDPGRHGNRFPNMAPRNAYPTSDGGWVALTAGTDGLVERLLTCIGREDLRSDSRFSTNGARVENARELDQIVSGWTRQHSREEVVDAFAAARVSAAVIADPRDVFDNDHFVARGDFVSLDTGGEGPVRFVGPLPRRTTAPGHVRHLGREVGHDNDAVYRGWLGLSAAEVDDLSKEGVL